MTDTTLERQRSDQFPTKRSRWKRLFQNLALSLVSVLLCLLALEGILRFCGFGKLEIYEPDRALYWKLKPNQDCFTKIGRKPVHINSHGTRGPEFATQKPPNTVRLLSLGDSRTFGWGLTEAETYSDVLRQHLQELVGASQKVEVINAGVNAWSYPQLLVYFREVALKYQPDFVILADANLWTQFSEKNSPEFVEKFMSRVRLKNLLRRSAMYHFFVEVKLKNFYERHRTKFIPVDPKQDALFKEQQQSDPDAVFRDAIEGVCRIAQTNGVTPVLLFIPDLNFLAETNSSNVLRVKNDISRRLQVALVDLMPDLAGKGQSLYLEGDPVHLNVEGNQIAARRIFETMAKLLRRPTASGP